LLEELAIGLDVGCALFRGRPYQVTDRSILGGDKQFSKRSFEIVAETGLNMVMKRGFAHDVEIYSSGFVIIFDPSDLRLVEFKQLSVQLFEKIVYLARLPVEAENRLGAALARVDDVVENLVNRGNLQPNLRRVSNRHLHKRHETGGNVRYQLGVTLIFRRGRRCRPFRRVGGCL
jgi:hypothetical protein